MADSVSSAPVRRNDPWAARNPTDASHPGSLLALSSNDLRCAVVNIIINNNVGGNEQEALASGDSQHSQQQQRQEDNLDLEAPPPPLPISSFVPHFADDDDAAAASQSLSSSDDSVVVRLNPRGTPVRPPNGLPSNQNPDTDNNDTSYNNNNNNRNNNTANASPEAPPSGTTTTTTTPSRLCGVCCTRLVCVPLVILVTVATVVSILVVITLPGLLFLTFSILFYYGCTRDAIPLGVLLQAMFAEDDTDNGRSSMEAEQDKLTRAEIQEALIRRSCVAIDTIVPPHIPDDDIFVVVQQQEHHDLERGGGESSTCSCYYFSFSKPLSNSGAGVGDEHRREDATGRVPNENASENRPSIVQNELDSVRNTRTLSIHSTDPHSTDPNTIFNNNLSLDVSNGDDDTVGDRTIVQTHHPDNLGHSSTGGNVEQCVEMTPLTTTTSNTTSQAVTTSQNDTKCKELSNQCNDHIQGTSIDPSPNDDIESGAHQKLERDNVDDQSISRGVEGETFCCDICLLPYEVGDVAAWSHNPACKHFYHVDCITDWLIHSRRKQRNCPSCRCDFLFFHQHLRGNLSPKHSDESENQRTIATASLSVPVAAEASPREVFG